jgi:hypothetical protein
MFVNVVMAGAEDLAAEQLLQPLHWQWAAVAAGAALADYHHLKHQEVLMLACQGG